MSWILHKYELQNVQTVQLKFQLLDVSISLCDENLKSNFAPTNFLAEDNRIKDRQKLIPFFFTFP